MAYTVKLKNQAGIDMKYSDVENVTIPLASGSENAIFTARYNVVKPIAAYITYDGGDYASNGVDYMCRISTGDTGKNVPNQVLVTIGGEMVSVGSVYTYTKLTATEAFVKVNGSHITGDIRIVAEAVTPSA